MKNNKDEFYYEASVTWTTEDFADKAELLGGLLWETMFDKTKFKDALILMIKEHDANYGINWSTVEMYLNKYCKK